MRLLLLYSSSNTVLYCTVQLQTTLRVILLIPICSGFVSLCLRMNLKYEYDPELSASIIPRSRLEHFPPGPSTQSGADSPLINPISELTFAALCLNPFSPGDMWSGTELHYTQTENIQ